MILMLLVRSELCDDIVLNLIGNWDLDKDGEHKWKSAEERRRFYI